MKPAAPATPRLAALRLVAAVLDQGQNLSDAHADQGLPDPRDRGFARHLAYGILRWLSALDWLAGHLLERPLKTRDRDIHRLVLLGLFQLWQDGTPPHAAIHEAAESARTLGKPWAVGLINAVLRRFERDRAALLGDLASRDERFAHPPWLLEALRADWPDDWEAVAAADNEAAPLWLRLRPGADRAALLERFAAQGLAARSHAAAPDALAVEPAVPVERLPGFAEGLVSVQDPAAQLAAALLDLQPGQRVLDACAAPGGKTCHILDAATGIELTALDAQPARLALIRENLERLGLAGSPGLDLRAADASAAGDWWDGRAFQRILLDAPCSATGVIRRHPEIKWLRTPQQVTEAVALQARLLDGLWPLLAPGGMLLYATCSVLKDENSRQIRKFLSRQPDARLNPPDVRWGHDEGCGRQILPGEQGMDGFFYARLLKT